jgi:formate/nitrite transporter FocA (FNT family)
VVVLAVAIALALLARLAADSSHTYFEHLASAALCWMVGSAVWLAWLAPRLLRR